MTKNLSEKALSIIKQMQQRIEQAKAELETLAGQIKKLNESENK